MSMIREGLLGNKFGVPHYHMYIDGEWFDTDEWYEIRNPATEELVATVARGNLGHVNGAVAAAKTAFEEGTWRNTPVAERARILRAVTDRLAERTEELVPLHAQEIGAPIRVTEMFQFGAALPHMHYLADLTERYEFEHGGPMIQPVLATGRTKREPVGVCAGIVPWNFPLPLAILKIFPALGAGNTIVIKPDEHAPLIVLELAREFEAAGLPAGVLNIVTGEGEVVGARLADHPDVRKIGFTGSTAVGREVLRRAADNVKKVTLELGGKGANLVLEDADLETAVDGALFAFLIHSGQVCVSGTRLLLPTSLHDDFLARMVERIKTLKIGDLLDYDTDFGPVYSAVQQQRILDYIASAKEQGATLVCGGGVVTGPGFDKGFWIEPTIFTDVTPDMRFAREEIFGPVLAVLRYDTIDEAIALANDSEYGLSAGVWTRDTQAALDIADRLDAGMVWINDWHVAPPGYPIGGTKQSGFGREGGPRALDEYTEEKFISYDLSGGVDGKAYGLLLSTPPS